MTEHQSLSERSLRSIKWNYLGTIARIVSQFVAQILLARLLGPETLGNFGYVLLLSGLLGLIIDQGLGWAIVHTTKASDHDLRVVFCRVMLCALACSAGTYLCADQIATLMGAHTAAQGIRYSALGYLFVGFSVVAQAQLRKTLRFREIQIAQVTSYIVAYPLLGVGLAFFGYGILSLIAAWLLQAALSAALLYRSNPFSWHFANPFSKLSFGGFGRDILLINAVNWIVDNAASALIARFFGPAALGLYNTTLGMVRIPANHLVVNLQTVLFPTAAAVKDDVASLGKLYRTALASVLFFSVPTFGFVAVMANEVVDLLLGPKWAEAGPLLRPIALAMIPHTVSVISGSILSGRGDQKIELASQTAVMLLVLGSFFFVGTASVTTLCWIFLGIYCSRACFLTIVASTRFSLGNRWVVHTFRGPVTLTALWVLLFFQVPTAFWNSLQVIVVSALGLIAIAIGMLIFLPSYLFDKSLVSLFYKLGTRFPLFLKLTNKIGERND